MIVLDGKSMENTHGHEYAVPNTWVVLHRFLTTGDGVLVLMF